MARAFIPHTITDDSALGGSVIERSFRFNRASSTYIQRTSTSGNVRTWTVSFWMKFCEVTGSNSQRLWSCDGNSGSYDMLKIEFYGGADTARQIAFIDNNHASSGVRFTTKRSFRDPSAWYHIIMATDTTQSTASDRVKIYVNGERITEFVDNSTHNHPPNQNYSTQVNAQGKTNTWGRSFSFGSGSADYFDGYLAEINFVDGLQLSPTSLGYTDFQTKLWRPKRYTGSYGTNGYYLNFSDNSSITNMCLDKSGNGNNFSPDNCNTEDSMLDTPTNNFCLLNINDNNLSESSPHFVYSEGNLKAAWSFTGTNFDRVFGSLFIESSDTNKYYWEATGTQNNEQMVWGVIATDTAMYRANNRNTGVSAEANVALLRWASYGSAPYLYGIDQGSATEGDLLSTSNGNPANNDIFSFVFDAATGKFYVFFKGVELSGQNYSAGTSVFDTVSTTKTYALMNYQGDGGGSTKSGSFTLNFGQDSSFAGAKTAQGNTDANGKGDFYYAVPTGAKALCSANLPTTTPSIIRPQKHFDTLIYSGTGSTQSITGLEFTPDLVWIKKRNVSAYHQWFDTVRGATRGLFSNIGNAEYQDSGNLQSFIEGGFTADGFNGTNASGGTYVAWCWKAGGSSNTFNIDGTGYGTAAAAGLDGGTITPSGASINTESGFSILKYQGNGTGGASISHGLGKAPKIIFHKSRDQVRNWYTITTALDGSADYLYLNLTNVHNNSSVTVPSSTLNYFTSSAESNDNNENYILYAFTDVPGYSKIGTYEGNQDANGTYVHLGFKPAFIMMKNADNASNRHWCIVDATRTTSNKSASAEVLFADDVQVESYANNNYGQFGSKPCIDILSNGFKVREGETSASTQTNRSNTHIYMAFADQSGSTAYQTETNAE